MKFLTDNLLDSSTETLVVKIPRHPTAAKIEVRSVKGHSLAAVVVNNASKVVLSFDDARLNCTNIGGNLWALAQHAIPIDWLACCNLVMTTDGTAKEWVYIPRLQELQGTEKYTTELLTPNSSDGGSLVLDAGTLRPMFVSEKCECGCSRCTRIKANDQTICEGCLCTECNLKHVYMNGLCVDCDRKCTKCKQNNSHLYGLCLECQESPEPAFVSKKCVCVAVTCGQCVPLKANDQTFCDVCLCTNCKLKHVSRNGLCLDCEKCEKAPQ